jgi:hypothetical protein
MLAGKTSPTPTMTARINTRVSQRVWRPRSRIRGLYRGPRGAASLRLFRAVSGRRGELTGSALQDRWRPLALASVPFGEDEPVSTTMECIVLLCRTGPGGRRTLRTTTKPTPSVQPVRRVPRLARLLALALGVAGEAANNPNRASRSFLRSKPTAPSCRNTPCRCR